MVAWSSMGKVCNGWCWHWKASEANEDAGRRDFRTQKRSTVRLPQKAGRQARQIIRQT